MVKFAIKKAFSILVSNDSKEDKYPIELVFSDRKTYRLLSDNPEITIIFKNRRAEWHIALYQGDGLLESYMNGDIDIVGDDALRKLIRMAYQVTKGKYYNLSNPLQAIRRIALDRKNNNTDWDQAKRNQVFHYGLPAEFFLLWLGETGGYSEGYWQTGKENLDQAQHNKFNYICRKLKLKPGIKMVEVGSGYGYMSILAAEKYGADVVNYGLVEEQNRIMRQWVSERKLNHKIKIVEKDHRELSNEPNTYDRYVSIGVYDMAGKDCHRDWIKGIAQSLKPGGIGLISTTGRMHSEPTDYFITKYIFPGAYCPSLAETLQLMEDYELTVLDIENLKYHYYLAINEWYERFIKSWDTIVKINPKLFNEQFKRKWSVYLLGSSEVFRTEHTNMSVYHIVFVKGKAQGFYSLTRDFLYPCVLPHEQSLRSNAS